MTRVSEATVSGLGGALVEAHLEVEFAFMSAQLFLGEGSLVLVSHFGSESGSSELWVLLCESSQSIKAQCHLSDVATFEQVGGLEDFFLWDSVFLDGILESKINSFQSFAVERFKTTCYL